MHFTMHECEQCRNPLEVRILGLSSGLGPPALKCGKCGLVTSLGRKEWPEFRAMDIARFVSVSVVAVVVFGFLGAIVGSMSYPIPGVRWSERVVDSSNPGFYLGAAVFALLAVALQLYRVAASRARAAASVSPFTQSWRELHTNVQAKACLFALALAVTGGGLGYMLSP